MATLTARTPNPPARHTNNPGPAKPPARVKLARPPPRGDTPRFSLAPLTSLSGTTTASATAAGGGATPIAGPSNDAFRRSLVGINSATSRFLPGMAATNASLNNNNNNKKRVATDVLDLTHTTTGAESDSDDAVVVPQTKRSRTSITTTTTATATAVAAAAAEAKRKSKQRADKEKLVAESAQWRAKYKKAFPSFTFYFDALDATTEQSLVKSVQSLGASVDNFFSKKVTHVVTSRPVPAVAGKENSPSVPGVSKSGQIDSMVGPQKTKRQTVRSPTTYSLPNGQMLRPYGEGLDKNPFIDSQDILSKAVEFKLKIWHLEKIQLMLTRINSYSPTKADASTQRNQSLPSLLRDEQLYGTRERDPFVPRADTYYFPSKSCYILVEDSTGEHRPVVIKEYERPRRSEDPSWPVLWGGVEGRGGFYHYDGPITYERRQPPPPVPAPAPVASMPKGPTGHAVAAARAVGAQPSLRRSLSLQVLNKAGRKASALNAGGAGAKDAEYIAASGNSQIITSNTATSTRSGAPHSRLGGPGAIVDKRLAVLNQRTVPSMALGSRHGLKHAAALPGKLKRSVSVDAGLNARAPPPRDEPKKPGYCENCRIKYDDFKDHVVSSKHRRFAQNPKNWVALDKLLSKITRPMLPQYRSSSPVLEGDSGFFDGSVDSCGSQDEEEVPEDDEELSDEE